MTKSNHYQNNISQKIHDDDDDDDDHDEKRTAVAHTESGKWIEALNNLLWKLETKTKKGKQKKREHF